MIVITKGKNYTIPLLISTLEDPLSFNTNAIFSSLGLSVIPLIFQFGVFSDNIFKLKVDEL